MRIALSAAALLLSACSAHAPIPSSQIALASDVHPLLNGTPPPGQAMMIANASTRTIEGFWRSANGNVGPRWTIGGSQTELVFPTYLAVDPTTESLWVSQGAIYNSILEFARDARGNVAPLVTIHDPLCSNGSNGSYSLAVDTSGDLFVAVWAGAGNDCILMFPPGSQTATKEIDDPALMRPEGLIYSNGMLYVADMDANAIDGYPSTASGTTSPTFQITGAATQLKSPQSIGFDKDGALYVDQRDSATILAYDHPVAGNMAPTRTIPIQTVGNVVGTMAASPLTLLVIAQDASGPIVETYRDISKGGAPLRSLGGTKTRLTLPKAIVLR